MKISDIRRLSSAFKGADPGDPNTQLLVRKLLSDMGFDPDNVYQELEMESLYADSHRDISHPGTPLALHSHGFYELIYCRSGGTEYLLGTERYRLQRGDIVLIPPGTSHRPILPKNTAEPYKRYVIWISIDFMGQYFRMNRSPGKSWCKTGGILRSGGSRWEWLREFFRSAVEEAEALRPGWETVLAGSTLSLLAQLDRAAAEHSAPLPEAEAPELLDSIIAYIEDHLDEKLRIAHIAERFYVSESTVSHLFRSKMGISFYGLVTQRRLIAAKDMIVRGKGIEEIASAVGYGDYSAFYRAFKKEYGISPRQFKALREGGGEKQDKKNPEQNKRAD